MQTAFADALTPIEAKAIATLLYRVWPQSTRSFEERLARVSNDWVGYDGPPQVRPRYFLVWDRDVVPSVAAAGEAEIAATALAAPRTIRTAGGEMTILALARVCTAPDRRGLGLGERVVRAAFRLVDDGSYPFALFQTTTDVRPFYEKLGACTAANRFVNSLAEDPDACPFWSPEILRYPAGTGWPHGAIDLQGPAY